MSVIVYSTKSCGQCVATMKAMDKKGITYKKVDISEDAEAMALVKGMGYQQVPVVMAGTQHWAGFRPDMINKIAA